MRSKLKDTKCPTYYRLTYLSIHISWPPHSKDTGLSKFDREIWHWKSKVIAQGYIVGSRSYRLTSLSFPVNRPSLSWATAFSKFVLQNQRPRSWMSSKFKVTKWVRLNYWLTSLSRTDTNFQHFPTFIPCQLTLLFLWDGFFNIWPCKSKVKVISPWSCTTTGLDNSIEFWTV